MADIKPILSKYLKDITNIYKKVNKFQKRNSKYKIDDIFRVMIESSFKNNCYSDFVENYSNIALASSGNLSYWTNKIYEIDISHYYESCY